MLSGIIGRSYRFAFLFSILPQMSREANFSFYDKLAGEGVELPVFEQKKNEILLQKIGNGRPPNVLRINVGHFSEKFRLFIMEDFPEGSMKVFNDTADIAWKVFSETWSVSNALQLAEVTLRYTVPVGGNSLDFLLDNCLRLPTESLRALERELNGVGIRLVSPVTVAKTDEQIPLSGADFNVNIETLLEDPTRLYIQVRSKWPSIPLPTARRPDSETKGIPTFLNPECQKPSWYLNQVESFVETQIEKFLALAEKK